MYVFMMGKILVMIHL